MTSTAAVAKAPRFGQYRNRPGALERACREKVMLALESIEFGRLTVSDAHGVCEFGTRTADCDLDAHVVIRDANAYVQVALGGSVGAGESYAEGHWSCDDLLTLLRILVRNDGAEQALDAKPSWTRSLLTGLFQRSRRNTVQGSRNNIAKHYDLGNDFYRLWLDETMTYSCAIFSNGEDLSHAQLRKYEAIAETLELSDRDSVLEIGCGWGGFALYAAQVYGCHVTATTISREQYRTATLRVREAGLGDRINVLFQDYRELRGSFDKIVSIEMFEAVGHEFQSQFFAICRNLLRAQGHMLLQTITIAEDRYEDARKRTDFIQRYIFPGGALPSDNSLANAIARTEGLCLLGRREIGSHYATTLKIWRERFAGARKAVADLGFEERFVRMWEFYLSYCEAGFRERSIGTVQALIERSACPR